MEERAWYVVQTYSGMESAAQRNIKSRIDSMGMQDVIFNVLVPEITEYAKKKNGETKEVKVKPFPGYVFIDMIVTDDSWFMVRNTPMVTGFLGSSGGGAKPVPLQDEEIAPVLKMCGISVTKKFAGKVGDRVRITGDKFTDQEGVIDSIDEQKEIVKVLIELLGRQMTAEISFDDVIIL